MVDTTLFEPLKEYIDVIDQGVKLFLNQYNDVPKYYETLQYHLGFRSTDLTPLQTSLDGKHKKGKRLRPLMCLLVYKAIKGEYARALPLITAFEFMHSASLVHDDIQDGDELRWGRPTYWKLFGVPQGVNGGDTLIGLTYCSALDLLKQGFSTDVVCRILGIINNTHIQMVEGQYMDIDFESRMDVSITEYLEMISKKTASPYDGIAQCASFLAGVNQEVIIRYKWFGRKFGMLFQLTDDVMSIWGNPEKTGKEALGDIKKRKKTLPILYALEKASPSEKKILEGYYGSDPEGSIFSLAEVLQVLETMKARDYCMNWIHKFNEETLISLEKTEIRSESQDILKSIVEYCYERVL
jgi:geranylgeranyl diphosphate synthase type I